ncbi:MAG: acetyl-CoA C-acetyltransferase [Pseudomonadales bacterium]|jgi:acetyl-CoA C-acetyltransferase|nr:acetyl-CoA C-acetyltransferase [Pseudomonadales bacterium]MCP5337577.1 acetyl-CoA C-acetyltransferase [Pseudomonadales bacterium]
MAHDALIFDAIRTPRGRGKAGGGLYEVKPIDLLLNLMEAIKQRNALDTSRVEDLIIACGEPVGEQGQDIARTAVTYSSWGEATAGVQIHRYCAGGLDAVNLAAAKVMAGVEDLVAAGGVESMSRLGIGASGGAQGDPWVAMRNLFVSQGVGADLVATLNGFSREDVDRYALMSQQRASAARAAGRFRSLVPVRDMNGVTILDHDELIRPATTLEDLARLKPSFAQFGEWGHDELLKFRYPQVEVVEHVHTPGNSSGIVDGAGLLLIGNERIGRELGLTPRARIVATALVGTESTIMLEGPAPATRKALAKAGLKLDDIDLFELNEAFAAVVLRYQALLGIPDDRINVNGGAIAMGHPIGATGAMILGTLLDELERRGLRRGLCTLCAGGGIGIATIIERV